MQCGTLMQVVCDDDEIQGTAKQILDEHNSVATAEICGYAMGHDATYLDKFCKSFTESIFASMKICDRIDYFHRLEPKPINPQIADNISWETKDGAVLICDKTQNFGGLNLALLRQTEGDICSYAIRWYNNKQPLVYRDPHADLGQIIGTTLIQDDREYCHCFPDDLLDVYWNFRRCSCNCGVRIHQTTEAVMNPRLTRNAANFIRWASVALGFGNYRKG